MAEKRRGRRRRRAGKVVMSDEEAMTRAITGRRRKTTTWAQRIQDLVKAHGSEGARERLGVSKSTWRAWTTGRRNPSKANQARIVNEWNTRAVRQAMIPKRRASKASSGGFFVALTGYIGPLDTQYRRYRSIATEFPPDTAQRIMDAFVTGGPDAAKREIQRGLAEHYFGHHPDAPAFADELTDIKFTTRDGPGGGSYFDDFDE